MTASRQGGSTLNVGSYIMSFGGLSPGGQPVQDVDIFDPRRPRVGWQQVGILVAYVRSSQVRLDQVKSGQVRLG